MNLRFFGIEFKQVLRLQAGMLVIFLVLGIAGFNPEMRQILPVGSNVDVGIKCSVAVFYALIWTLRFTAVAFMVIGRRPEAILMALPWSRGANLLHRYLILLLTHGILMVSAIGMSSFVGWQLGIVLEPLALSKVLPAALGSLLLLAVFQLLGTILHKYRKAVQSLFTVTTLSFSFGFIVSNQWLPAEAFGKESAQNVNWNSVTVLGISILVLFLLDAIVFFNKKNFIST